MLDMAACTRLLSLPDSFCHLSKLTKLAFGYWSGGCHRLVSLPEHFGELTNIKELHLSCCSGLKDLPGGIFASHPPIWLHFAESLAVRRVWAAQ